VKKKHKAEEVVAMVRDAEVELGKGVPVEEVCRKLDISQPTLFRWRHKYGGLSTPEAKRLRSLERENRDLKEMLAESELAKRVLQTALKHLGKA
jgi:transposase-like protein